jgi:hypothetical protein
MNGAVNILARAELAHLSDGFVEAWADLA